MLKAQGDSYAASTIDFTEADLTNAVFTEADLTADGGKGADIDFTEADLANADLSGSEITADTVVSLNIPGQ